MDEDMFYRMVKEAVQVINAGHKIIVSGLGKNVPICEKFVGSMISMGMRACFLHTNSAVHGDLGVIEEGDMIILLTKSGETGETVYLLDWLEERRVSIWLLTFCRESTLARRVKNSIILELRHEGDLWNIMPNNSTTLNLIILQGLAMQIAKMKEISIEEFGRNHPGGNIGKLLKNKIDN